MSFTEQQVREIFYKYVPDVVEIAFIDRDQFIYEATLNPFIKEQMRIGIYDEDNIADDFLSAAKAYSLLRRIEISMDVLNAHIEGVDESLADAYINWIAAHEAHHFEDSHMLPRTDPRAQALHEKDCNETVSERYPHLDDLVAQFEKTSPVYQRVYARIAEIAQRHEATG